MGMVRGNASSCAHTPRELLCLYFSFGGLAPRNAPSTVKPGGLLARDLLANRQKLLRVLRDSLHKHLKMQM